MQIIKHHPYEVKEIGTRAGRLFAELLTRLEGMPYMLGSGTALGLFRDNDLIPSDTDIDFIFAEGVADSHSEQILKIMADATPIVTVVHNDVIQQLAYVLRGTIVDFHFYHKEDGAWVCHHQNGTLAFDLDERQLHYTKYGEVGIPEQVEDMLEREYGDTWRTPILRKKPEFRYKRGVLFGVFDPLHYGHVRLFEACRKRVEILNVVVRSDEHIRTYKHREPMLSQAQRVADVEGVVGHGYTWADEGSDGWAAFERWARALQADVFFASAENRDKITIPGIPVVYMERTPGVSSSQLRTALD